MSFMNFFKRPSFDEEYEKARQTPNALLLDVRTPEEYQSGHLPDTRNVPLDQIANAEIETGRPVFVFCHSGMRSRQACSILESRGYDVTNIGGIMHCSYELIQGK